MKYSVHCPEFFSGTSTRNFLIFYMKLGCHLILKVTQLGPFEKKIMFWCFWATNTQNEVFQVL